MITVSKLKTLNKLKLNNKVGDLANVQENHQLYRWNGTDWVATGKKGMDISLYQINKMAMNGMPEMSDAEINKMRQVVNSVVSKNANGVYWMLLSNEAKSYTIFESKCVRTDKKLNPIGDELVDTLKSFGAIKSIDIADENPNALECWITNGEGESFVYYFFNYDNGVIQTL